ncbi:hypothetical protein [Agrobacterium pusense]|uniref:hypothetical protein n=1 Tax=Agrobacterium pusense TaxID=648995 RepID=UPI0013009C4E|nr:hypothetical protein [Agrobacterium pusense]
MTAEVKHTPGPWELVSLSGYGSPFSIRMPYLSNNKDAPPTHYGVQSIRRREDAHLIAAAPDLLEALIDCVGRFTEAFPAAENYEPIQKARAAIARAEGRS